jgi:DNA-binding NarL/FixJ family response regulator
VQAAPSGLDSDVILSQLLARQGWFYASAAGVPKQGQALSEEGLVILRRSAKREHLVTALDSLCMTSLYAEDPAKMRQAAWEGLQIARDRHEPWWEGRFLLWLGQAAKLEHEYAEARQLGQESLAIAQVIGDLWLLAVVYAVVLGDVAYAMGDYAEAKSLYQQGMRAFEELGMPWGMGRITLNLGQVAVSLGDYAEATSYYGQSLQLYREIGQTWELINTLVGIARLQMKQGRKERAVELLTLSFLHPASSRITSEQIVGLLAELEADLPSDVYADARERGGRLKLETVIAEPLEDVGGTRPRPGPNQTSPDSLSGRELEVLRLLADGLSNAEIGQKLFLSVGTVKVHTHNIYAKLGTSSRTQAVAQAHQLGLL